MLRLFPGNFAESLVVASSYIAQDSAPITIDGNSPITWAVVAYVLIQGALALGKWYTGNYVPYLQKRNMTKEDWERQQDDTQSGWYRRMIEAQMQQLSQGQSTFFTQSMQMLTRLVEMQTMMSTIMQQNTQQLSIMSDQLGVLTSQETKTRNKRGTDKTTISAATVSTMTRQITESPVTGPEEK